MLDSQRWFSQIDKADFSPEKQKNKKKTEMIMPSKTATTDEPVLTAVTRNDNC